MRYLLLLLLMPSVGAGLVLLADWARGGGQTRRHVTAQNHETLMLILLVMVNIVLSFSVIYISKICSPDSRAVFFWAPRGSQAQAGEDGNGTCSPESVMEQFKIVLLHVSVFTVATVLGLQARTTALEPSENPPCRRRARWNTI